MRLIDADAFKEYIRESFEEAKAEFQTEKYLGIAYGVTEGFLKDIDEQPTVEAKPVHGEWIKIKDWDENDNALFECTNCHYGDTHAKSMKVPYCWHCGAKMSYADMRGGKNE